MPSQVIQWFPGHMAKTRRMMAECLPDTDIVFEVLDARIPKSSRNPEIKKMLEGKPSLLLLNKASLADPKATAAWSAHYKAEGDRCLAVDCITGEGIGQIATLAREILADKLERYRAKGMEGRHLRAMIVGIPNVGKSSLINRLCGAKKARVEDRPGVTLDKQWVSVKGAKLDLLDMPGVLWPKFDDVTVGENLAITGAIRDQIMDIEEIALLLVKRMQAYFPALLCERYRLAPDTVENGEPLAVYEAIAKKRGFVVKGGEVDYLRTAEMLLDEFRAARPGRITLEMPSKEETDHA